MFSPPLSLTTLSLQKKLFTKNPKSILITADNEGEIFKLKIIAISPSKKVHLRKGIFLKDILK
jgi:hypothetical protein